MALGKNGKSSSSRSKLWEDVKEWLEIEISGETEFREKCKVRKLSVGGR